ncbi:MAG: RNA polymerase sigma factor [Acidobacteria bacterium]|nr:RNA polymerase sigma factor [Acidobacteriota bacterium]
MAHVQAGETAHVGTLFHRHHRPLFGYLYRMNGHGPLCEDLVQEVFLRVLRYAHTFKPGSAFKPWLYQIARNVLADHWKRLPPEVPLALDSAAEPPDPDHFLQRLEADQDHHNLLSALACLPRDKRELLLLSRNPDLSYEDIAGLLQSTPGAIKVRVHRALNDLKAVFFRNQEVRS